MRDYPTIARQLLNYLPKRTKSIIAQRFGLFGEQKTTLEAVGRKHKVTRERIRQIEKEGLRQLKKKSDEKSDVFSYFRNKLEEFGGVKREGVLITELVGEKRDEEQEKCVLFLLNVCQDVVRLAENKDNFSAWALNKEIYKEAVETSKQVAEKLKKENRLMKIEELLQNGFSRFDESFLLSSVELSKKISKSGEGFYGLSKWPEINPRGIKDRAYIVLKKNGKPLHFKEVARLIGEKVNSQTTHNELIKDPRFVLIGRGVYALAEWGYKPGEVKEVIRGILKEKGALHKKEIIVRVSEQRIVKENTIIQNLSNKKHFIRTPDGKYTIA